MFLITLTYKKPLDVVDHFLAQHRAYLDEHYEKGHFVVSGPKNPRVGAVMISQLKSRNQLEDILRRDPFTLNDVVEYTIEEFVPVKFHRDFASFIL